MKESKFGFWALKLTLIMVIVFVLQVLISGFNDLFILDSSKTIEIWRVVTSIFLHGSLLHLLYNGFALMLFGSILERIIGSRKFLLVFFVSGIFANIFSLGFYNLSLGASGAIFGVIGCLVVLRPGMTVWAYGLPMPFFIAGILWAIGDIIGIFVPSNVGNIAHLSGLFVGLVFGALYRGKFLVTHEIKQRIVLDEEHMRNWEDTYLR